MKWVLAGCRQFASLPLGEISSPPLATVIALLLFPTALQASSYTVSGRLAYQLGFTNITLDTYDQTDVGGASGNAQGDASYLSLAADSAATSTGLHAHATTVYDKPDESGSSATYTASANSSAIATWSDFLISGPVGASTVPISLNLHLDGVITLLGDSTPSASFPAVASGSLSVAIRASGNNVGDGQYLTSIRDGVTTTEGTGILTSFSGDNVIQSLTFNAPVNTPFSIQLSLGITAGIGVQNNQAAHLESSIDFGHTLAFATDRPAFNLPVGYTIDSSEANIVNNTAAVPEPTAILLLGFAALPLLYLCRRRSAL